MRWDEMRWDEMRWDEIRNNIYVMLMNLRFEEDNNDEVGTRARQRWIEFVVLNSLKTRW